MSGVHAADKAAHRSTLGRLDGVPAEEIGPVRSGLDELLRHCRVLSSHPRTRPLAEAQNPNVLLETVAHVPDQRPESAEAWGAAEGRYFGGDEPQELLALVKDLRDAAWHDEPVVKRARADFYQGPVGEHARPGYGPVIISKRPVRPRMRGVVGAGGEKPPATRLALSILQTPDLHHYDG